MATEARIMPRWGNVAAVRQVVREQRGRVAAFGDVLWRRKLLLLACLGVVLGLTAAYISTLAPAYQAEALVAVGERAGEQVGRSTPMEGEALEDQLRLIESRAMAERLVDRLDLHFLPEFRPEAASRGFELKDALADWLPDAMLERLPSAWADPLGTEPAEGAITDEQRAARLWEAVIDATMPRIRAEVEPPSVIGLKFVSKDRQLAAAGANALAELYLEERAALRQDAAPSDRAALQQEIGRLRAGVRETQQAIEAARAGAAAQAGLSREQSRLDLTGELAFWRRERADLETRLRHMQATLESGAGLDRAALFVDSERLAQLRARASELQQAAAALAQQYGEQDPQMVELRAELAALEQERRAEIEYALQGLQEELAIIRSREAALETKLEALGEQPAQYQAADNLALLERRLEAERAALRDYLEQAPGQLGTRTSATASPDARVIAPAAVPEQPTYPRLARIWGVACVGALLLGMLLAFALEAVQRGRA